MRFISPFPLSLQAPPPRGEAAIIFNIPRLGAPVQGSKGQVSPVCPPPSQLEVGRYVRLGPLLMGLQGDEVILAK